MEFLSKYQELLAKVDAKFNEISSHHPLHMKCRKGCYSCCLPGLTVNKLEAENIRLYLEKDPSRVQEIKQLNNADPFKGRQCSFLLQDGACAIYPVRPVVCRSHGVPISYKEEETQQQNLDVCPLNFEGEDLKDLPPQDSINIDTLNTILALLNRAFGGEGDSHKRYSLSLKAPRKYSLITGRQ